jgi:hypothetical protein
VAAEVLAHPLVHVGAVEPDVPAEAGQGADQQADQAWSCRPRGADHGQALAGLEAKFTPLIMATPWPGKA